MRSVFVLFLSLPSSCVSVPTAQEEEQLALFSDLRVLFAPAPDGRFENRVGFEFASLALSEYVHLPGEIEPSFGGMQSRIRNFSQMLLKHPTLRVHIDAHVGLSAPCMIAQPYSEERARLVAFELEALGVPSDRITSTGWGKTVTRVALTSAHPNAASAKSGYGWAEIFLIVNMVHSEKQRVMPPRPDYYADLPPTSGTASWVAIQDSEATTKLTKDAVATERNTASFSGDYTDFYMRPRGHGLENVEFQSILTEVETSGLLEAESVPASETMDTTEKSPGTDMAALDAPRGIVGWSPKLLLYIWEYLKIYFSWEDLPEMVKTTTEIPFFESIPDSHVHDDSDKRSFEVVHSRMVDRMHRLLPVSLQSQRTQMKIVMLSVAVLCASCCIACLAARSRSGRARDSLMTRDGATELPAPHPLLAV